MGASILQLPAIKKAKELNLNVVVADMDPNALGFKEDGVIKEVVSTIDLDGVLEAAKRNNIDGIMTLASDKPVKTCAYVGEKLGLNTVSTETSMKATNKALMRDALKEYNVPIPKYFKINNKDEYLKVIKEFKSKCIVKPADNSGSRGIYLINDLKNEKEVLNVFNYSMKKSSNGFILIEEFMEGPEVSVECLCLDGKCNVIQITDKLTTGAPYFVEMGHNEPSMISEDTKNKIKEVASMATKAIGIQNGAAHVEIKVTDEGPKIVELGARLGGDNITTSLVPLSTGVDMVESCIKIALGEKPNIDIKFNKGSAIRYFKPEIGLIKSIDGIEDAKKINGVKQITIVHDVGDESKEIKSSNDRVGFVIAQADNPKKAIDICEKTVNKIKIKVIE